MSLFTTANLLIGTGVIHCGFGLLVPPLRDPLVRAIQELTIDTLDINERYARNCSFWFQIGGVMMIIQGCYIRSMNEVKEPPKWFGWTLAALGILGVTLNRESGFWLIIAQGVRIIWIQEKSKLQ